MLKKIIIFLIFTSNLANASKITVYNQSKKPVLIKLDIKNKKDKKKIIPSLGKMEATGFVKKIIALEIDPGNKKHPKLISLTLKNPKKENNSVVFDYNEKNNPILYEGMYGLSKPISFLTISDQHPITTIPSNLRNINQDLYNWKKSNLEQKIKDHKEMFKLKNQMMQYIANKNNNIWAVIMAGDMAGGFGKKSETKAFKQIWYDPLMNAFKKVGGNVYVGIGNHDTYWSSPSEPKPPAILRFIKETYGSYLYSFNIGPIHFIHLGLHPSINRQDFKYNPNKLDNSLLFLKANLAGISKTTPIVIFFHYPIHGEMSDWWTKAEKADFYNTIKDYNVILIIVGHHHKSARFRFGKTFGDKVIPVVQAAGDEFAMIKWSPLKPTAVEIQFINKKGEKIPYPIQKAQMGDKIESIFRKEIEKQKKLKKLNNLKNEHHRFIMQLWEKENKK
ncbi:hypothetical protein GF322_03900 [Candidatus Dependentiae bacterium]|nr:hypothetical protein [Candidatus Dependentiae bacterium]